MKGTHNTWKLNRNILMVTDIFFNQKRVNVCEHTTKMAHQVLQNLSYPQLY